MKKKFTIKTINLFSFLSLLPATCYLLLVLSCEQPFKAGLGPIIDLRDPTIDLKHPTAGAYIRGEEKEFTGVAEDDYKLDSVWFHISNYPEIEMPKFKTAKMRPRSNNANGDEFLFHRIEDTAGDIRNITWKFTINTLLKKINEDGEEVRAFPDGDFKIRLYALDSKGKDVFKDEIVFYIKNNIPDIVITAPPIQAGSEPGQLGGSYPEAKFNYDYIADHSGAFKRVMDTNSDIFGRISDFEGIYRGEKNPNYHLHDDDDEPVFDDQGNPVTVELFPPQIRFWQVYFDEWPRDKNGDPVEKAFKAGVIPSATDPGAPEGFVEWEDLIEGDKLTVIDDKNLGLEYRLRDESGFYYAFQVRAQSKDSVHSTAVYPIDYINYDNWYDSKGELNKDDPFVKENAYVLIVVREPLEYPAIGLYKFEDIYGINKGRVGETMDYYDLLDPDDQDRKDGNHVYVDKPIVSKKGPFTLRVKTSHGGGIASAKVYWEKSDKSAKGRFIWDWVDPRKEPYNNTNWKGSIPSKAAHYSTWGLNEPDGVTRVRSFVFTYTDKNPNNKDENADYDRLDNSQEFINHSFMGGDIRRMSKIQSYTTEDSKQRNKEGKLYEFDELPDTLEDWKNVYKLDEGTYNLYIYATSMSGTRIPTPYNVTLYIDRVGPSIELNYIEGSAGEKRVNNERENTVNGVIQPRFLFSDSRPVDTSIRTATSEYFRRDSDSFYAEQAYILIPKAHEELMKKYLIEHPWPVFPNVVNGAHQPLVLTTKDGEQVTVSKHGPIMRESSARFRTSKVYYTSNPSPNPDDKNTPDGVIDDGPYRMYVFARDNAFNVGKVSYPIIVDENSDIPKFDFSIGSVNTTAVTEPDSSYDYKGDNYNDAKPYEKSFITAKGIRGLFSANSSIQVKITDDDSLDLGVPDTPGVTPDDKNKSGIKVSLTGSEVNDENIVVARDDAVLYLSDAVLKIAFNPIQAIEGDGRTKVLESRSNITHKMLLDLLKDNGKPGDKYNYLFPNGTDEVNVIPDGIYRIGISIKDYSPAKLIMEPPFKPAPKDQPADSVTVNLMPVPDPDPAPTTPVPDKDKVTPYFWIAVDTHNPYIEIDNEGEISGTIIPSKGKAKLTGTVSDENGPITLVDWRVRNGNTVVSRMSDTSFPDKTPKINDKGGTTTLKDPVNWVKSYYDKTEGKWKYEFEFWLDMNGKEDGTHDFEFTFQDRFGNRSTKLLRKPVDNGDPRVTLIKKIETFSRPMLEDADLKPGVYPQRPNTPQIKYTDLNKGRLAVKTVNFSIIATDDTEVSGVRWWLLPVDTGSNNSGFTTTGYLESTDGNKNSKGYDAFPSNKFKTIGVYYGVPGQPDGFTKGVYGVVDVKERKFTIAFDSRKLESGVAAAKGNGEYRLHIVAADNAGNYSDFKDVNINITNVFQEVFFLQVEDMPYLDDNITPGYIDPKTAPSGSALDTWLKQNSGNGGNSWPTDYKPMVLGGAPIIRGTVWDNNGFFGDDTQKDFWPQPAGSTVPGSITIWFSGSGATLPNDWVDLVKNPNTGDITATDGTKYLKKSIPNNSKSGLGMLGRNISLAISLSELFPTEFKDDGNKRYIIKATDSPVNKLKEGLYLGGLNQGDYTQQEGNGIRMGGAGTSTQSGVSPDTNESIREFRFKQYAFVYDAVPPKVVIDTPLKKPVQTYGKNFKDNFILGGYISDANLERTGANHDGDYYFDYYLNTDTRKTFILKPMPGLNLNNPIQVDANGVPKAGQPAIPSHNVVVNGVTQTLPGPADSALVEGQHIYAITRDDNGKVTVYFRIKASEVTKAGTGIIPDARFVTLGEGQHTLTLWAADKSGKEGADWVDFIKDMEPPSIAFSNLTGNNRPYTIDNASRIVNNTTWWTTMPVADKQRLLLGNSATTPLPLTTIYYDTGIPELRGTITDIVSNIKLKTRPSLANDTVGTGDINISDSDFKYWIDGETSPRYFAIIDGKDTKSVRWTILLTSDGTRSGTKLYDGVHTIALTAADTAGEAIPEAQQYMIAFRIDSKPPRSAVTVTGIDTNKKDIVYGNIQYQNDIVFSLDVTGDDANLEKAVLTIKNTTTNKEETPAEFTAQDTPTWTYYPKGSAPPANTAMAPLTPPAVDASSRLVEDYVLFKGLYPVRKTLFTDSGKYDVTVSTRDTFGNKSEDFVFPFTYDKDSPVIEFTNPPDENKNGTGTPVLTPSSFINVATLEAQNKINRLTSENLRIQGNVKDTFSPIRQVQSRVERWNWLTAAWVLVTEPGQVDGWKNVQDYSANTQTQVAWTKNLLGQNSGDLDLRTIDAVNNPSGEGLYRIQIRAKDASVIALGTAPIKDGWTSAGQGNPITSQYMYFYFDRTNPTLEITGINGGLAMDTYYSNPGKFTFKGRVTDNNRFAKVEVKFEVTGKDPIIQDAILTPLIAGDPGYTNVADNPARTINSGGKTQNWTAEIANAGTLPDGKYKVTVTVYDMTGRSASETKSFILDSTAPTVRFTLPAKVLNKGFGDDAENPKPPAAGANGFASVEVLAGPTSVITGETGDKPGPVVNGVNLGEPGSQSGVDQMWFHLGFIDGNNNFPTKQNIKDWEDTKIREYARNVRTVNVDPATGALTLGAANATWNDIANLTIKQRNRYMDLVSERRATSNADTTGNAWFKLGGVLKPTGFVINNPNIYDWRFEIPEKMDSTLMPTDADNLADYNASGITATTQIEGLKLYGGNITVKGRTYTVGANPAGGRQMVRAIDGQPGGYYRLPLWVRLTDIAGNVEYYCHDIWIDMNGSIPSTTIESPSNGTKTTARGGSISVDGVAKSNTSVYDVIFRVFADGGGTTGSTAKQNTNLLTEATPTRPVAADRIPIPGYETADAASITVLTKYAGAAYTDTPWQKANLAVKGGSGEPVIPWSIMLNSESHIANMIDTKGFVAGSGSTPDTIRVWLEVFVFNGEGAPIRSSIFSGDNPAIATAAGNALYGNANDGGARPNVRVFFIKRGAAEITHPNVGTWRIGADATPSTSPFIRRNFLWNGEVGDAGGYKGAGQEMRSDKFAISAVLNPRKSGTANLGDVAFRIKQDGGSYGIWNTVWKKGDNALPTNNNPFNSGGVRISYRDANTFYFDYAIDSKNANPPPVSGTAFAAVNGGNWADTGGTITVQIRMRDDSTPPNEAERTIQVAVDNFTPLADTGYRTNPKVAGTNVNFVGRVYDYANPISPIPNPPTADYPSTTVPDSMNSEFTPRKLARVSVWFTKGTGANLRYVNMNQKNTTTTTNAVPNPRNDVSVAPVNSRTARIVGGGPNDAVTNITVTNRGGAVAQFTYPGLGGKAEHLADYVRDITPTTGQPQNKMLWAPVNAAEHDVRWSLTLDSTLLPDGEMTLHYIVVDAAGNASYYTQEGISVRNNYPEITRVTLYTDNNGQGAQYTMDDTIEYDLNNYRGKMFANYTDTTDNLWLTSTGAQDPSQTNPAGTSRRKTDTTGYLNSGFISKNSYIGFKVETTGGNRPLNFRLQHVTRERVTLNSATLTDMLANRNTSPSAAKINLYTIAWHGDYTPQKWRALGVSTDKRNPTLGTHFVFNPSSDFVQADAVSTSAQVWKYTAVVTRDDVRNPAVTGQTQNTDPFMYGPSNNLTPTALNAAAAPFEFKGAAHFATTGANRIREFKGSNADDATKDNPRETAFFLIRVWDTINTTGSPNEPWVHDQLYDALVVGMNVFLTDTARPIARLYDLNPYTETANVIDGNKNQTIKNAADPRAIGSNIVRGGLYNDGTNRALVRSGFIDPRNNTTALNPVNGVYDSNNNNLRVNTLPLPDYPLKVASDLPTTGNTNDKVSGKIILRGHAWDDQLIDTITLTLDGTSRTILSLQNGKMAATSGNENTAFPVEDLHWKTGHSVEWAYIWDTGSNFKTGATISVSVKDRNGTNQTSEPVTIAQENNTRYHNSATVDIVPYITGFERQTPTFTTKRSLQGWYSFYQGENGVRVNGYNFGTTAATISIGTTNNIATTNPTATQRTFNIPGTATSGLINLNFGTTPAYNNTSSTLGKSWNKEANSFTPGSDLWINRHYAHIWRTAHEVGTATTAGTVFAADGTSSGLDSPGMALQYTGPGNGDGIGRLHGSWTIYGRESLFYAQNTATKPSGNPNAHLTNNNNANNTTYTGLGGEWSFGLPGSYLLLKSGEPYSAGDIDYYNGANNNDYFNNTSVAAAYQRDGEPYLVLKPRLTSIVFNNTALNPNNGNQGDGGGGDVGYYLTRQESPRSTYRWKNTRIRKAAPSTADNNPGKVFVSAYDSTNKRLFFKMVNGTIGSVGAGNNNDNSVNNGGTDLYLDGGGALTNGVLTTGTLGTGPATGGAGNWSAIDYTSDGYPVVAYFDEQNQTLRLAYASSATPTAGNNWTRRYVLPETGAGSELRRGSGSYVSMKIDRATTGNINRVHLAFYNSTNKAVVYATAASPSAAFTATVIDRVVEGGQWTDISVDNTGNPWIVYADSARLGNRDGARIAYKSSGTGAFTKSNTDPISGNVITGWEALTMPANYQVNDDRLNIAAWPPTGYTGSAATSPIGGWNAAVGYASDQFRIGYFFKPGVTMGNN